MMYCRVIARMIVVAAGVASAWSATYAFATLPPIPQVRIVPDNGNLPLNSAVFSGSMDYGQFAIRGYVEREYYFSGTASVRDQETGAVLQADVPYTSRMVVRMPVDPKRFSGNVVLEPFHAVLEKSDMWMQTHDYMTRHGDVWVGYTVKAYGRDMEPTSAYALGGVPVLKAYDPERYAPLDLAPDTRPLVKAPPAPTPPQALELTSQVAALFKTNSAASPLSGMLVKKVFLMGTGINGEIIVNYLRTGQDATYRLADGRPLIDGYMAGATHRLPPAAPAGAAFVMFRSENEIERSAFFGFIGKGADTPSYRVYNVVGTAHLGSRNWPTNGSTFRQIDAILPKPASNMPYVLESDSCPNINDEPVDLFLSAILSRLELWGERGTALPSAPLPELLPADAGATLGNATGAGEDNPKLKMGTPKRDPVTGNLLGGVRMPWIEAPVASYPTVPPRPPGSAAPEFDVMHGGPVEGASPGSPAGVPGGPPPQAANAAPITPVDAWPIASKYPSQLPHKPHSFTPCFLFNPRLPYDHAKLHAMYSSYDIYVKKFKDAKQAAVRAGYLLPEDADKLQPRGVASEF